MKHLYPSRLLLAAALLAPCVLLADVIDPADYAASFNVKFTGYTGTTTLTDFPVLVRLSAARNGFNYSKCAVDGSDLRFSDADGNLIPHEIDTWDPSGESLVWVKVATLNRATVIRGYYGYQGAGDPPAVTAADVWDSDYVGVWHLGEAVAPLKESTGVSTPFDTIVGSPALAQSGAVGGECLHRQLPRGARRRPGRLLRLHVRNVDEENGAPNYKQQCLLLEQADQ